MLDRALVSEHGFPNRPVILAQDAQHLLGVGGLREGGEPAEVAEEGGYLAAVTGEELLPLVAREKVGRLRCEPRELGPLPFDRLEEADLFDRNHDRAGEGLEEPDLVVVERAHLGSTDSNDADRFALAE